MEEGGNAVSRARSVLISLAALIVAVGLIAVLAPGRENAVVGAQVTPTPYHEGFPTPQASPAAMEPTVYPLPAAQSLATADMMTAGGAAMIQAAQGMAEAAQTMLASGVPEVADRGQHWAQDADALRERGAWMVLASTAESMVHDPDEAHELDLQNLRGNGLSMAAEGQAMSAHGKEMAVEVEQLRQDGVLSDELAAQLATDAKALIDAGDALARDGERMREYAETLLQSIGQ